jgi:hypothetical protein
MLSRFLCWLGSHDWREMDGYCCQCGVVDKFQFDASAHADSPSAVSEGVNPDEANK